MTERSYRTSHIYKGKAYDDNFRDNKYDRNLWEFEKKCLLHTASEFSGKEDSSFLDFACGTCRISSLLEPLFNRSFGVDVSEEMMNIGRRRLTKTQLIKADITRDEATRLPQFDLITAFRFFPGAEDSLQEEAICKLVELLKPRGLLVFNNHRNYYSSFFTLQRIYFKVRGRPWNVRCLKESRARSLGKEAGLILERIYHWGVLPNDESKHLVPDFISTPLEHIFSRVSFLKHLSSSQIYVFRKACAE